jgi:hypothetical protein
MVTRYVNNYFLVASLDFLYIKEAVAGFFNGAVLQLKMSNGLKRSKLLLALTEVK